MIRRCFSLTRCYSSLIDVEIFSCEQCSIRNHQRWGTLTQGWWVLVFSNYNETTLISVEKCEISETALLITILLRDVTPRGRERLKSVTHVRLQKDFFSANFWQLWLKIWLFKDVFFYNFVAQCRELVHLHCMTKALTWKCFFQGWLARCIQKNFGQKTQVFSNKYCGHFFVFLILRMHFFTGMLSLRVFGSLHGSRGIWCRFVHCRTWKYFVHGKLENYFFSILFES